MECVEDHQQEGSTEDPGSSDVWEDIEMPVDEEFRFALREALQLLK